MCDDEGRKLEHHDGTPIIELIKQVNVSMTNGYMKEQIKVTTCLLYQVP